MSEEASALDLLRAGIEAYNRRDFEAMTAAFDPQIELHIAPGLGNPGTWKGIDGFREMTDTWRDAFAEDRSTIVDMWAVGDDHVIAEMRQVAIGSGSGAPVEMTNFYLVELRDGLVTRFHIYADRESALAAARNG